MKHINSLVGDLTESLQGIHCFCVSSGKPECLKGSDCRGFMDSPAVLGGLFLQTLVLPSSQGSSCRAFRTPSFKWLLRYKVSPLKV